MSCWADSDQRRQDLWCYWLLCRTHWLIWLHGAGAASAQVISSRTVILRHLLQPQYCKIKPKVESSLAAHPSLLHRSLQRGGNSRGR